MVCTASRQTSLTFTIFRHPRMLLYFSLSFFISCVYLSKCLEIRKVGKLNISLKTFIRFNRVKRLKNSTSWNIRRIVTLCTWLYKLKIDNLWKEKVVLASAFKNSFFLCVVTRTDPHCLFSYEYRLSRNVCSFTASSVSETLTSSRSHNRQPTSLKNEKGFHHRAKLPNVKCWTYVKS